MVKQAAKRGGRKATAKARGGRKAAPAVVAPDEPPTLTPKQEMFCAEYLVDLNATQAAIRAGYSADTARQIATENLSKPVIADRIAELMAKRAQRVEATQDYVVRRLVENVERAMQAEPVRDREGNETGEYTYAGAVANGALQLLGKHLGMFVERVERRDLTLEEILKQRHEERRRVLRLA